MRCYRLNRRPFSFYRLAGWIICVLTKQKQHTSRQWDFLFNYVIKNLTFPYYYVMALLNGGQLAGFRSHFDEGRDRSSCGVNRLLSSCHIDLIAIHQSLFFCVLNFSRFWKVRFTIPIWAVQFFHVSDSFERLRLLESITSIKITA